MVRALWPLATGLWAASGALDAAGADQAALRRGLLVHIEVCAACHAMSGLTYGDLQRSDGPALDERALDWLLAGIEILTGPDPDGRSVRRKATRADRFPAPFASAADARAANNGALPVDLATLGRPPSWSEQEKAELVIGILTGYRDPPPGRRVPPDRWYNVAAPGESTAMPPPLSDRVVHYHGEAPETVAQYASDVARFLNWAARISQEPR